MRPLSACALLLAAAAALAAPGRAAGQAGPQSRAEQAVTALRAGLRREHPRLLLTDARLAQLEQQRASDPVLAKAITDCLARAERALAEPPLQYVKVGPRLLAVSRRCLNRVYDLGLAFRLTGQARYADALRGTLLSVCAFPDWNPTHFLDTAEMAHAVGIGYDWSFDALLPETRATIRAGLIRNGLVPGAAAVAGSRPAWWTQSPFNWNLVCHSGLLIGALAVAETDPIYAERILPSAMAGMPRAFATYGPDGAWPEGPGYWDYATRYAVFGLAALDTALGQEFGLGQEPGLGRTGFFALAATGPTGLLAAYADLNERSGRKGWPTLFWLAQRFGTPALAAAERAWIARAEAEPLHVLWYPPTLATSAPAAPLEARFGGPVAITFLRSAPDPAALWVAFKAGENTVAHGHLDLGGFEFDALGVRWARDLGSDDYDLPGYFDAKAEGRRWTWYRTNSHSHSVITLDGTSQAVSATARFRTRQRDPAAPAAVLDLDGTFPGRVRSAARGMALVEDRRALLVQDELDLVRAASVTWAMTTDAELRLDGSTALLTLDGRQLEARVLTPAGAQFTSASAEQLPPQNRNAGVRRLLVTQQVAAGPFRIAVLLSPRTPAGAVTLPAQLRPLSAW